ncbi:hypothetical protein [Pedobacter gandavensis]|uniref:hypothetical protein n=1 Tax=Pedobacter gandavensis TaxID=2679963 RepID=UPI00292D2BF1|nr:hypothetical protein [Pedobacter gandavensis]
MQTTYKSLISLGEIKTDPDAFTVVWFGNVCIHTIIVAYYVNYLFKKKYRFLEILFENIVKPPV